MKHNTTHRWTIAEAKEFLVSKITRQSEMEGVPLSTVERRMLNWSEQLSPADQDIGLNAEFEDHYDRAEYEAKISKLVRAAYRQDQTESPSETRNWWAAIHTLETEDQYVLVMVEQASLRPPGDVWRLWGSAIGVLAVILGFIFLSIRFSFPDWVSRGFPWILVAGLIAVWTASSPERRKIARGISVGIGEAVVLIPQAIVTAVTFWFRIGLKQISKRSR